MAVPVHVHGEIVMAVHRPDPELLRRQVASLRCQTLADWTCRVGIDGSDPATLALLTELIDADARFVIHPFDDNVGVYRHVERLARLVEESASWVALCDQDDSWHSEKLARLVPLLNDATAAVSCQADVVDRTGRRLGRTDRRDGDVVELLLRNQLSGSLSVWRRDVVAQALPFPRSTAIAVHDHWLAVCAAAMGEVLVIDEALQDYVQHGGNVIGEARPTRIRDELRSAASHGGMLAHLDHTADERWEWRIAMAEELVQRGLNGGAASVVGDVAARRLTPGLARAVVRSVRRGRLRIRGAVGILAAAAWASWRSQR